jgi:hypothetical protein
VCARQTNWSEGETRRAMPATYLEMAYHSVVAALEREVRHEPEHWGPGAISEENHLRKCFYFYCFVIF